jgi:hypothetical protein
LLTGSIDIGDVARPTIFAALHDEPVRTPGCPFPVSSTTKYLAHYLSGLRLNTHIASVA